MKAKRIMNGALVAGTLLAGTALIGAPAFAHGSGMEHGRGAMGGGMMGSGHGKAGDERPIRREHFPIRGSRAHRGTRHESAKCWNRTMNRQGEDMTVTDPVRGMEVEPRRAAGGPRQTHAGRLFQRQVQPAAGHRRRRRKITP